MLWAPVIRTEQVANPATSKNQTPATGFTVQCVSKRGNKLLSIQQLPVQGATVGLGSASCLSVTLLPVHPCPLCVCQSLYRQFICALFVFASHSTASSSVPSLCLPVTLPPVHPCPLCVCPSLSRQYIHTLFVFTCHSTASTSVPSLHQPITLLPVHLCPLCISPSPYCQYICALFALAHHPTASTSVPSLH